MSSSRAIKPKRDETLLSNWESMPERAPSLIREDAPVFARIIALGGLFFLVLGTLAVLAPRWQRATIIPPSLGFAVATLGLCAILFHCFTERDVQFRRLYGFLGLALVLAGVVLRIFAFRAGFMTWFYVGGMPAFFLGLVVLIAVVRNEADMHFRTLLLNVVGALSGLMIVFCAVMTFRDPGFLAGEGVVFLLLALLYIGTYIGQQEADSENGYRAALGLGGLGAVAFLFALIRSLMPESTFLIPNGLVLMGMSIVYIVVAMGVCCDWPVIVIARRDLAAYFYSPIAYLVFVGLLMVGWISFDRFVDIIEIYGPRGVLFEPIVRHYVFEIFAVITQIFLIPVVTMRLLSEERRSGTLEVLLTAPVNEVSVVLGKFLAAWTFYMLTWMPLWVFLVSLRYFGAKEFDYRPVLSFTVALAVMNAGLLSMGLFFSSLTSNQIIAAVLTFVGVVLHLAAYFLTDRQSIPPGTALHTVLSYVNFLELWNGALQGTIAPRLLVFHLSVAIFFLFASVKMLESRKWS